jgi:hypothetical protein
VLVAQLWLGLPVIASSASPCVVLIAQLWLDRPAIAPSTPPRDAAERRFLAPSVAERRRKSQSRRAPCHPSWPNSQERHHLAVARAVSPIVE